jgi:hypothetical protein
VSAFILAHPLIAIWGLCGISLVLVALWTLHSLMGLQRKRDLARLQLVPVSGGNDLGVQIEQTRKRMRSRRAAANIVEGGR